MKYDAILISGTPASGKDTLTTSLLNYEQSLSYFLKHKTYKTIKSPNDGKYIYISKEAFNHMESTRKFIQYHGRYGNFYGISKESINEIASKGKKPIIHVGNYSNLRTILKSNIFKNPLKLLLFTDESQTIKRLARRHPNNNAEVTQRMNAYFEEISTMLNIAKVEPLKFNMLFVNNYNSSIEASKELIDKIENANISNDVTIEVLKELRNVKFPKL